jgi:PAS domain S-box-containing protein
MELIIMEKEIRILTVEDSPEDLELVQDRLKKDGINYSHLNVETRDDFIKGVNEFKPDIILSNFTLSGFDGLAAIELSKELSPLIPIIIVPGSIDKDTAVECINKGAEDSIIKENIMELGLAVKGALENKILKRERDLEKRILKLHRTYAVIHRINEMIVSIQDREKLFEEACKIAVESGKFRLVWIGLVDEKNKIIKPHIWNGLGFGFLEEIKRMSVDDISRKDPIQKEILTGNYFVCNNIDDESGFILQENGLKHGFHSLISMPLIHENKVIGSFNIYADEPDFFDEDEIKLLNEVSRDISFSLESITKEKTIAISELRYKRLFESAREGIIILDADNGEIVDVNPFVTINLGYSNEELIGKHLWEIGFLKDVISSKENYLKLLEHEYVRYDDLPLRRKDGTSMDVEFFSNVYMVADVKVIQCNIRDITARKHTEDLLHESEDKYRVLAESSPGMIFLIDVNGYITYMNNAGAAPFNVSPKEIIGKHLMDIFPPDIAQQNLAVIQNVINTKYPSHNEREMLFPSGKIWVESRLSPVLNKENQVVSVLVLSINITERKMAEKELRKLSRVVEQGPASVVITNREGDIEYVNQKYCDISGYSKEEVIGKNPRILNSGYHDKIYYEELWETLLSGNNWNGEILNKKKNGELYWESALISPLFNNEGDITNFVAIKEDITERKKSEKLISMLAQSLKSINEFVSITDMEDKILFVNESYLKTYGYDENELIGKHVSLVISPINPMNLAGEIFSATRSGGWKGEVWNKRKDGSEFPIYLSTSIIYDKDGKPLGLIGVAIDITEHKQAEKELIESKETAESANKLKDAFVANISHEIRTPLNGILGMASLIREIFPGKIKEKDEELFAGIEYSSKRIIKTIDMILNYSRLQVGVFPVFPKKLELSSICVNLVREYATAIKYKSLELIFQNNCGIADVFADEYSITMAISNLIDNAIKYTDKGFINVSLYNGNNDDIILDVKDTGIGIVEENLVNIFEPYRQEQMGYGRAYEGIGLGLSLVKKVLTLNNAKVFVESKKGEGTTFSINFGKAVHSVDKMAETGMRVNIPPASEEPVNGVVLIVEDDKINQLTIKKFLETRYTTIITDSSDEALEILKMKKVDIILMDISIWGKKNGLELTKELKASKEFSHIPVIAITANAFEDDKQNALEAGCDNYLAKPFSKKSLLNMIAKLVYKS